MSESRQQIIVVGSGFAGLYAALELQKLLRNEPGARVLLVNRENFFSFTPMLHEVAASDLDLTHIVNPVRKLLKQVAFLLADVERIDLERRCVHVAHGSGADRHGHELPFDQLVIALGSVTNYRGIPGLAETALSMKSLGDAIALRNRLIQNLEDAATECAAAAGVRDSLLTCVVAGGGFAGVETLASINDFVRQALRFYPSLRPENLRMLLVHSGDTILPELDPALGRYAAKKLVERGVELRLGVRVKAVSDAGVELSDGSVTPTRCLVWTAGTSPHPMLSTLPCKLESGRLRTNELLEVDGFPGIWALGDCAFVPDPDGRPYPPTAQHALRQGRIVAHNVVRRWRDQPLEPFRFKTIGQLATIGRRSGVASIFGMQFSGVFAWWLWRTIYLAKLPRTEKKLRVILDWTLDLFFSKDLVQYSTGISSRIDERA